MSIPPQPEHPGDAIPYREAVADYLHRYLACHPDALLYPDGRDAPNDYPVGVDPRLAQLAELPREAFGLLLQARQVAEAHGELVEVVDKFERFAEAHAIADDLGPDHPATFSRRSLALMRDEALAALHPSKNESFTTS